MDEIKRTIEQITADMAANDAAIEELFRKKTSLRNELVHDHLVGWIVVRSFHTPMGCREPMPPVLLPIGPILPVEISRNLRVIACRHEGETALRVEKIPPFGNCWEEYFPRYRIYLGNKNAQLSLRDGAIVSVSFFATEAEARTAIPAPVDSTPPATHGR